MPAPAMGPVPLGMRLPTHHCGKLHTDLADLALVQVGFRQSKHSNVAILGQVRPWPA